MKESLKIFGFLTVLTGILYPLFITGLAFFFMEEKAGGSIVFKNGKPIGSLLIAQPFKENKYFWPRPSAIDFDPLSSGGSNLSLTNRQLKKAIEGRQMAGHTHDLLYTSGSGLDPHISLDAASSQAERVAKARSLEPHTIKRLIEEKREGSVVNVLKLNLSLEP